MKPSPSILVSHPTVNQYVRALVSGLHAAGILKIFHTTIAFGRREIAIPHTLVRQHPTRELLRLLAQRFKWKGIVKQEFGFGSVDAVALNFDKTVSRSVKEVSGVYCYEDSALSTFRIAGKQGIKRFYELPILYWSAVQKLLGEEAERYPEWEPTLLGTRESPAKIDRKAEEVHLADLVICPSLQIQKSLPNGIASIVAEYGCPEVRDLPEGKQNGPLRFLFVGSMSQRKGLADLFQALQLLDRSDVELVLLGAPILSMDFYRRHYPNFIYEPPRSNAEVRRLMQTCDVLVLPSIVEGRALVQMEAMSCGLPIVVTANAGAEDLVIDGETGFLVPIRNPEKLAETIAWIADNRDWVSDVRPTVFAKAKESGWNVYIKKVISSILETSSG